MRQPTSLCMFVCTAIPMLLFLKFSNQAAVPCSLENVGNCPDTLESWNAAAHRKNCSNGPCGNNSVYHCLPTEKKQLVEVCADPINLIDVCPYYDTFGKSIQRSKTACVSVDSTNTCTDVYSSANVYE